MNNPDKNRNFAKKCRLACTGEAKDIMSELTKAQNLNLQS